MSTYKLREGESMEKALKNFRNNCNKEGIRSEAKKREFYESPSIRRRKKSEAARAKKRKFK